MSKLRLRQLDPEDATPGQLVGLVDGAWGPVDPPAGGGGGEPTTGPFFDDFARPDTPLAGDNGWTEPTAFPDVATFYIEDGVVQQTGFGAYPILHDRGVVEGVADITCSVGYGVSGAAGFGYWGICVCSDASGENGLLFMFDGSDSYYDVQRMAPGGINGGIITWDTEAWVGWVPTETMVLRCVYTEATSTLEVYQNDVLTLSANVSDAGGGFGFGVELVALAAMPKAGFLSNNGDHSHTFDLFSIDQATEPPAPAAPEPAFDVTEIPLDPPYTGYAAISPSTGIARVWTGGEWWIWATEREDTVALPSLWANYDAEALLESDGAAVATWTDSSGNGNDAVASAAALMETAGINGHQSLDFAGHAYTLPEIKSQPITVFVVMQNDDGALGSIPISRTDSAGPDYLYMGPAQVRFADHGGGYFDQAQANPLDPHILYGRADGVNQMVGCDGVQMVNPVGTDIILDVIGYYVTAGYAMDGRIGQVLIYDAALTDAEVEGILGMLSTKWGIPVA